MSLPRIESLLQASIGLDPESIGHTAVGNAVRERIRATGAKDTDAYHDVVAGTPDELQALVEAVVVPETWFFRDRVAFAVLSDLPAAAAPIADAQRPVRLLSIPCSTGEEPYSMAMALLDAGVPAHRIRVDAVDISAVAIARAERAVFSKNSFRGDELGYRDRYFTPDGSNYRLRDDVRARVRFARGNLFDAAFLGTLAQYDAVFCRNLLIYFDREGQDRVIEALTGKLTQDGTMFVGPSESALLLGRAFESLNVPLSFGFRRVPPVAEPLFVPPSVGKQSPGRPKVVASPADGRSPAAARLAAPGPRKSPPVRPAFATTQPKQAAPVGNGLDAASAIELAEQLADQGRLADAARACDEVLRDHGPSAQAYYLLGLVRDTMGLHAEAAELYGKALYLDPQHHAALLQLASLRQQDGDAPAALRLRARADRAERANRSIQAPGAAR